MRPMPSRRTRTVLLAALLGMVAGLGSVRAQIRGAAGVRAGWIPPFAPASTALMTGIQAFMKTGAGMSLASQLPSLGTIQSFSPASDADLRVLGALAAHLPADFEARLAAAPRWTTREKERAALARALGDAYQAAVPEVARTVGARADQVAASVAYGRIDGRQLVVAANQLERFGLYGAEAQAKAGIVRRLASQQIMEDAQRIASDFLRLQRPVDDGALPPGQGAEATRDPGVRKKIPEAWKLQPRAKPAPSAPKADPMSRDLYARLGAAKGMTAAELEAAYRRTAESYRPERYLDRDTRSILAVTMAFKQVEEAFAVLGDPAKRAEYDRGGSSRPAPLAPRPLSSDFYERIGATRDMSQAAIKKAYHRAAAAYHPDKSHAKDAALVDAMTKAFQDIGEAYATLSDPQKRAAYDRKLASPRR